MSVEVYDSLSGIPDHLEHAWRFPQFGNFFLSLDWFECLLGTVLTGSMVPRIYVASNQHGQPVAALVCGVDPAGMKLLSLSNFYSIEFGVAVMLPGPGLEQAVDQIATFIAAERPRWTGMELRFMTPGASATEALVRSLAAVGFRNHISIQYENWYLRINGRSFAEYFSSRSKKLRKTIPYMERKVRRTEQLEIRVYTEDGPELDGAIDEYVLVYNKSWKNNEPYPEFIPALIRVSAKLGILRLGILYMNGAPVAAQLWLTSESHAMIYKIAYDENFKDLSVGSILSMELFRQSIDQDNAEEIDYGLGSEAYKQDWMESKRDLVMIEAYNVRTLIGLTLDISESMKHFIKRMIGRGQD